jgi:hypothetical protein
MEARELSRGTTYITLFYQNCSLSFATSHVICIVILHSWSAALCSQKKDQYDYIAICD